MTNNWTEKKLGDLCRFIDYRGKTPKKTSAGIRLITAKNVKNGFLQEEPQEFVDPATYEHWMTRGIPRSGDLIFTTEAPLGNIAQLKTSERVVFAQRVILLQPNAELDPTFLMYLLLSDEAQARIRNFGTGATVLGIKASLLKQITVPFPKPSEQQRIVAILDEAFESIATARANTERNIQNARLLFESHLESVVKQQDQDWAETRLDEVCEIVSSLVDPRSPKYVDLVHVGAGNIESKTGTLVELKSARQEELISGKFHFRKSMVLYSKIRPYLMKVARPDFDGICSADVYPLAPIHDRIDRNFLFHLLLSAPFTAYAIKGSERAGMPKVNRDHLFAFRFCLPTLPTQKTIAAILDSLLAETQRLEAIYRRKLAALDELKKSLLHQAFTGQL